MAKLTLTDVSNITGAESAAIAAINANWDAIIAAMENTLSRDGTTPNTMSADLDLNNNDILNGGAAAFSTITLGGVALAATTVTGAATILTALKTVDGAGSGLDADLLDGNEASYFQVAHSNLNDISGLAATDGNIIVGNGANFVAESGATARASLGVSIGSQVQAWDADLDTLAANGLGTTGLALLADATAADARNELDTAAYVADLTAVKAVDTTKETLAWRNDDGHEGYYKWRTGDYSAEVTADTQGGSFAKADAIATTSGAWQRVSAPAILRQFVQLEAHGGKLDGTTVDDNAWSSALATLEAMGGGELRLGSGVSRVNSQIIASVAAREHIIVTGRNRMASQIDFSDAATLGFKFSSTSTVDNRRPTFVFHRVGLITSRDNAGVAIDVEWADADNFDPTLIVDDVFVGSQLDRTSDQGSGYGYWSGFVLMNNARNWNVRGLHAIGEIDRASNNTSVGVRCLGESTAGKYESSLILECVTGSSYEGTSEGIYTRGVEHVATEYGFRVNTTAGEPTHMFDQCHADSTIVSIWLTNAMSARVSNCDLQANAYQEGGGGATGPWPEWYGVLVDGSDAKDVDIQGCRFAVESPRSGDTRNGIDFKTGYGHKSRGNSFEGLSTGNTMTYAHQCRSTLGSGMAATDGYGALIDHATNQYRNVSNPAAIDGSATRVLENFKTISGVGTAGTSGTPGAISFAVPFQFSVQAVQAIHAGTNAAVNPVVNNATINGFDLITASGGEGCYYTAYGV